MTQSSKVTLTDPGNISTVWASELYSIEVSGVVTILTFAEHLHAGRPEELRRVSARIAIQTSALSNIAQRIAQLKDQATTLSHPPAGSA